MGIPRQRQAPPPKPGAAPAHCSPPGGPGPTGTSHVRASSLPVGFTGRRIKGRSPTRIPPFPSGRTAGTGPATAGRGVCSRGDGRGRPGTLDSGGSWTLQQPSRSGVGRAPIRLRRTLPPRGRPAGREQAPVAPSAWSPSGRGRGQGHRTARRPDRQDAEDAPQQCRAAAHEWGSSSSMRSTCGAICSAGVSCGKRTRSCPSLSMTKKPDVWSML